MTGWHLVRYQGARVYRETRRRAGQRRSLRQGRRAEIPMVLGKLAPYIAQQIERWLVTDGGRIKRDRRTGKQIFEGSKGRGYSGRLRRTGFDQVADKVLTRSEW